MIKSLLATAAALVTSLTLVTTAEAALNHKGIATKLNSIGVSTEYGTCTGIDGIKPIGSYNFINNHFCISDEIRTNELLEETVIHELVHVIQDCLADGGIADDEMGSVTRYLSEGDASREENMDEIIESQLSKRGKLDHVHEYTAHMEPEHKWVELEAYHLETSPLLVLTLLNQCKAQ